MAVEIVEIGVGENVSALALRRQAAQLAAAGTTSPVKIPTTENEVKAFLLGFAHWVDASEKAMLRWREELMVPLALGAAPCDELRRYNQRAVALWSVEKVIIDKLREVGVPAPMLPFPVLFADRASVAGETSPTGERREFISWSLSSCDPRSGWADPRRIRPQVPCPGVVSEFDGLEAAPVAVGVGVLVKWLLVIGASAVAGYYGVKLVNALRGVPAIELEVAMREIEGKRDAERAAFVNRCATDRMARLGPADKLDPEVARAIYRECFEGAETSFPRRPITPAGSDGLAVKVALVGAAVLGGMYLASRWRT